MSGLRVYTYRSLLLLVHIFCNYDTNSQCLNPASYGLIVVLVRRISS